MSSFACLIVHGIEVGGGVLATGEHFTYWPPARGGPEQDAFANFGIAWQCGTLQRGPFKVCVGGVQPGDNHFDLVLEDGNLVTTRVGIRPWKSDQSGSDPTVEVLWAEPVLKSRASLKMLTLAMRPGQEMTVWLLDGERLVDNGPAGKLNTFVAGLDVARTDENIYYDARVGYFGRQVHITCLTLE